MIFQLRVASRIAYKSLINKFIIYSVISIVVQVFVTLISCYLTLIMLRQKGIIDGMPIVGTALIGGLFAFIIFIIIGIQLYKMYSDIEDK